MIPLLAASALMAVGGGILNAQGAKREARRRQRAIDDARRKTQLVSNDQIGNNAEMGKTEQNALLAHLTRMSSQQTSQAARDQVLNRTAAIDVRAGSTAPAADADPLTQAAYARSAATGTLSENVDQSNALLRAIMRGDQTSGATANTEVNTASVPWLNRNVSNRMALAKIRSDLEGELGVTGNSSANMQLLGSLLNTGANAGFSTAGRIS
jgi:hypothetical protein